jgi:hypothetical protein
MKSFNQQFEDYKLELVGKESLAEESFLYWAKNFLNKPSPLNPKDLLTGKIYTFEYLDRLEKQKKFINKRPVIFFSGFETKGENNLLRGIDLILVPPVIRLPFFNRIISVYESQIRKNTELQERGEIRDQIKLKTDFETLDLILSGIPFKNSYRSWDLKKIRDLREIPYRDWTKIVYLYTRSIEGTQIEEIYKKNIK